MTAPELALFQAFLGCASRYLEWGSGGSTALAARTVRERVLSVDSSAAWLARVASACADAPIRPDLHQVDLGPVGHWGFPIDESRSGTWHAYHESVWDDPAAASSDLFMVDGRFRVACTMQVLLRANPHSLILIHDFSSRGHYHAIRKVAREIARAEDLSVFRPHATPDHAAIAALLEAHAHDPA